MSNRILEEKSNAYDRLGVAKHDVDKAIVSLKAFRAKYPFTENLRSIEWLDPDRLFKLNPDQVGEFFNLLEDILKPFGQVTANNSNLYRNTRLQIGDFKNLLRAAVDDRKSLAQKIDAPWQRINGLGQDRQVAKNIIFCFNYESGKVLPIYNTNHLRFFANRIGVAPSGQRFDSPGEEFAHYTAELLKAKDSLPTTKAWTTAYFARFLYDSFPPPDSEKPSVNPSGEAKTHEVTNEQLELRGFVKLLADLQTKGKITGQQFRESRDEWVRLQPNDRDVLVWRLKQLLAEPISEPKSNLSENAPKKNMRQRL